MWSGALPHESWWVLAWKAYVIIGDNQAGKKQCAVMRSSGCWGGGRGVATEWDWSRLIIHKIAPWSLLQKVPGMVNTHLRRIYDSDTSLGGLSTCFTTGTIRGDISFFMCDTYNRENASFLPPTSWLMPQSSRREISAEFKVGRVTRSDKYLNLENVCIWNIYDNGALHLVCLGTNIPVNSSSKRNIAV